MALSFLIVLTGSLGDIARALCLPAHLKACFPECRLTWQVDAASWQLAIGPSAGTHSLVFDSLPLPALPVANCALAASAAQGSDNNRPASKAHRHGR